MFGFGLWELLILTVLIGMLFGFRRLPQLAREAGRWHATLEKLKAELRNLLRFY